MAAERETLRTKTLTLSKAERKAYRCGRGPYVFTIEQTECPSRHPLNPEYVWMRSKADTTRYVWGPQGPPCHTYEQQWSDFPSCGGKPK